MDSVILAQWQFAATCVYHFFFVPLTLGLSVLVAIMETIYVRTGNPVYKKMTKFWGKLFLINFAMGVVTGIVMEFQFGMNWSEYSRFVGDIFGAPLALEALIAFFLESTFLGVWIFGWEKLSKRVHLFAIWCVAVGSTLSALWILIANSFMQQPVGFEIVNGRAIMTDFSALLLNKNVWLQFPHVVFSGFTTAAMFVLGISAYHLIKGNNIDFFKKSFKLSSIYGLIAIIMVIGIGHAQAQHMVATQPMKMASAEALWDSADPAPLSIVSIIDEKNMRNPLTIQIPGGLSLLSYNRLAGEVKGITELQAEFEAKYGPGDYIPPVTINFWTFRFMVGSGFLMVLIFAIYPFMRWRKKPFENLKVLKFLPIAIALPYVANTSGWLLTELGRQPWVVYGVMKIKDAVSPNVSAGMVLTSLIGFVLLYGLLMFADVYLLVKYAKAGPDALETAAVGVGYQE
ncbi:MAG: cytochrome ubiquinol oxidase subunit I [Anaerolineaceae bacterium]|nr:cytochrome ubiquinol oxidase subunit I [Anaerolineaceae bacterium]